MHVTSLIASRLDTVSCIPNIVMVALESRQVSDEFGSASPERQVTVRIHHHDELYCNTLHISETGNIQRDSAWLYRTYQAYAKWIRDHA